MSSRITVTVDLPVTIPDLSVRATLPFEFTVEDTAFFEWWNSSDREDVGNTITPEIMRAFLKDGNSYVFYPFGCDIDAYDFKEKLCNELVDGNADMAGFNELPMTIEY